MEKEKKIRPQYNWKFKPAESDEFHEWFNNQHNIGDSLRSIVYHMIDLYGTADILNPITQKKIITDSIVLEHFEGRDAIKIIPNDLQKQTESNSSQATVAEEKPTSQPQKDENINAPLKKRKYKEVDENLI